MHELHRSRLVSEISDERMGSEMLVGDTAHAMRELQRRVGGVWTTNQIEKFHPRARIVLEDAEHRARDSDGILLLDAAHRHAQVRRFHDDADAEWTNFVTKRFRNLIGEPLLHLQSPREDLDEARNLAQAEHAALRNVGDVALPEERQQVMLAETVEVDVLHDHHLVIIDGEECVVQNGVHVGGVAAGQELQ